MLRALLNLSYQMDSDLIWVYVAGGVCAPHIIFLNVKSTKLGQEVYKAAAGFKSHLEK